MTASAGTSTCTTSTRDASGSSAPATTPTSSPSGCRRSTAWSRSSSAARVVADVGCGHGSSTILMAQAFPHSTFVGSDYHEGSIETARAARSEAGVADRVRFEVAPAAAYSGVSYDLVTMFDCLHDMGDPVGASRHVLSTLQLGRHLDDRRAQRRRPHRGQLQPGRPRLLRVLDSAVHARPRCRRTSVSRWGRRPVRRGSATSCGPAGSPASAARRRRRSTSCSRRGRDHAPAAAPSVRSGRLPGRPAAGADARAVSAYRGAGRARRGAGRTTRCTATGERTVLLLPTWSIIHSRFWKCQIPYLARHRRVVTFDGRGNGRSDRPTGAEAYATTEFAADALAVIDATDTDSAALVALSCGALWGTILAAEAPQRVERIAYIGPAVPLAPGHPERERWQFEQSAGNERGLGEIQPPTTGCATTPDSWSSSSAECLSEPHCTKEAEDCVGWALETTPETLIDTIRGLHVPREESFEDTCARVRCPVLVLHGDDDRIRPHAQGEALARATGGELVTLRGSGHLPFARDPVKINLLLGEFLGVRGPTRTWTRSATRAPPRALRLLADRSGPRPARRRDRGRAAGAAP